MGMQKESFFLGKLDSHSPNHMPRQTVVEPINVLIYETDESSTDTPSLRLVEQASRLEGVEASIFGRGQSFEGFGSKYAAVYPVLKKMSPTALVVLSDGRDVLLNNPASSDKYVANAVAAFRAAFEGLTVNHPGAVVISAEAQCCVSALTHAVPGNYYNTDGSRNQRACASGEDDCLWEGDVKAAPWEAFMKEIALRRSSQNFDDVYLNAGLMAGSAGDLVRLIERANIGKDEDDQAVLTDFMYNYPESIVLDYGQTMFGNNRGGLDGMEEGECMFTLQDGSDHERLVHKTTLSSPLFVHSPGGFLQCHEDLSIKLGFQAAVRTSRRLKQLFGGIVGGNKSGCNYRKFCLGNGKGILSRNKSKSSEEAPTVTSPPPEQVQG
jgi:hypothetical protein